MNDRVLLYSSSARIFRTTLIGYLFEISRHHPVTLLCEELDPATAELIADRNIFPGLQETVPVRQYSPCRQNRFRQARRLCDIARKTVQDCRPAIVVAPSDNDSIFEMFLMRFARRAGAFTISISCVLTYPDVRAIRRYVDLLNIHERMPACLPIWTRLLLVKLRKYAGHALIYWILPVYCRERPFWGLTSYILHRGHSGMRDAQVQIVMHERDASTYEQRGVPRSRLVVLGHPLLRDAGAYLCSDRTVSTKTRRKKILVLLPENKISFRRTNQALISKAEVHRMRCEVLSMVARYLPGWTMLIKPHPVADETGLLEEYCRKHFPSAVFLAKEGAVEETFSQVSAIIELPRSGSAALYTASLWRPEIPKMTVNCYDEFYADYYQGHPGIEYLTSMDELRTQLSKIHSDTYVSAAPVESESEPAEDICSRILDQAIASFNRR